MKENNKRSLQQIDGIVVLNKPTGMNSMKAVKSVQYKLGAKKAGHLGTLDPYGTGVLLVALGKATKTFDKHLSDTKIYHAVFKFGIQTDTLDSEGKIIQKCDKIIQKQDVLNKIDSFVGKFEQLPPIYSAKKINGKKAYELARAGKQVQLKTKKITIFDIKLLKQLGQNEFLFQIVCSSGTYIRSICRDLAASLGTVGTMVAIIRTKAGEYPLQDSVTLENLTIDDVITDF